MGDRWRCAAEASVPRLPRCRDRVLRDAGRHPSQLVGLVTAERPQVAYTQRHRPLADAIDQHLVLLEYFVATHPRHHCVRPDLPCDRSGEGPHLTNAGHIRRVRDPHVSRQIVEGRRHGIDRVVRERLGRSDLIDPSRLVGTRPREPHRCGGEWSWEVVAVGEDVRRRCDGARIETPTELCNHAIGCLRPFPHRRDEQLPEGCEHHVTIDRDRRWLRVPVSDLAGSVGVGDHHGAREHTLDARIERGAGTPRGALEVLAGSDRIQRRRCSACPQPPVSLRTRRANALRIGARTGGRCRSGRAPPPHGHEHGPTGRRRSRRRGRQRNQGPSARRRAARGRHHSVPPVLEGPTGREGAVGG